MKVDKYAHIKAGALFIAGIGILFYETWKTGDYVIVLVGAILLLGAGKVFGEHEGKESLSNYIDHLKDEKAN